MVIDWRSVARAGDVNGISSVQINFGVEELEAKAPVGDSGREISEARAIVQGGLKIFSIVGNVEKCEVGAAGLAQAEIVIFGERHSAEERNNQFSVDAACENHEEGQSEKERI